MLFKKLSLVILFFSVYYVNAQETIKGLVFNEYLEPFYKAKITGPSSTTFSNIDGEFELSLKDGKLPKTLTVSADGFQTEEVIVNVLDKRVKVILKEKITLDEIIISASRAPERIIESPVTIERLGLGDIRKTPSNSFYAALENLKGVNVYDGGYGYKIVNTRGFSTFSNSRFVQLIDGVDAAAPALNFSQGNVGGVPELDIQNVEILLGASSALYGANAYNGLMLMTTKSPFEHTGVSAMFKGGATKQEAAGVKPFYDGAVRFAYKFDDHIAAKFNFQYFDAEEWHATDYRNLTIDVNEIDNINKEENTIEFNGVNTYGDEVYFNLGRNPLGGDFLARRKGYTETDLINRYRSKNLKATAALHLRPMGNQDLELIFSGALVEGDNILQGNNGRYAQRDYYYQKLSFEAKAKDFFVRAYHVKNDAGKSYNFSTTAYAMLLNANYPDFYFDEFLKAKNNPDAFSITWAKEVLGYRYVINSDPKNNKITIGQAKDFIDKLSGKLIPGTESFNKIFNILTQAQSPENLFGLGLYDKSSFYHFDGNMNFSRFLDNILDFQVGGSYRVFNPDSRGTIFNDAKNKIDPIKEYGAYAQLQKKLFDDRLKLTGSVRFDKSTNFEENYSPRFAVNYSLGEKKNHILRASYQTGFRNPTIQEQYLLQQSGTDTFISTTSDNINKYQSELEVLGESFKADDILNNSLDATVLFNTGIIKKNEYSNIKPESVKTIELGYRSLVALDESTNLDVDFNAFYSTHNDFIFNRLVTVPFYGKVKPLGDKKLSDAELTEYKNKGYLVDFVNKIVLLDPAADKSFRNIGYVESEQKIYSNRPYVINTNSKSEVNTYGASIGFRTKILNGLEVGLNYNYADLLITDNDVVEFDSNGDGEKDAKIDEFDPSFNMPKHTVKLLIGKDHLFKNFGFNVSARWLDAYRWTSNFVKGYISSRRVVDAQINYRIPSMKSVFKLGGTNLTGTEYRVAPGTGNVGSTFYFSWIINN